MIFFEGRSSVMNSCFINNNYDTYPGIIYADANHFNEINNVENNCGVNNTYLNIIQFEAQCEGIFFQSGGSCTDILDCNGTCDKFAADSCQIGNIAKEVRLVPSSEVSIITTWADLVSAVTTAAEEERGGKFIIQPGSTSTVTSPIFIAVNNTVIQCGENGLNNNCVFFGGEGHFEIKGSPIGIVIRGLTFVGGKGISVIASGDATAHISFIDCEWTVSYRKQMISERV